MRRRHEAQATTLKAAAMGASSAATVHQQVIRVCRKGESDDARVENDTEAQQTVNNNRVR